MRKAAFYLLWAFVFVLEFEDSVRISGIGTLSRVLGLVAGGVGVLTVLYEGRLGRFTRFHVVALLYMLWVGASYWWSPMRDMTLARIDTYLQLFAMVWLLSEFAREEQQLRKILQAFVLGAWVLALSIILLGQFTETAAGGYGRTRAFDMDPNLMAFKLALALPIAWYLALLKRGTWMSWLNLAFIPLGMYGVFSSGSRTGVVSMAAALLMVPLTVGMLSARERIVLFALVLVGMVGALQFVPETAINRLIDKTVQELETGEIDRVEIWTNALSDFSEHALVGVGAGAILSTTFSLTQGRSWMAHNTFISVLVEQGLVGFFIFLGLLYVLWRFALSMATMERKLFVVLLLTWCFGAFFLGQEYKKHTWFVFGMTATYGAAQVARAETAQRLRLAAPGRPFLSHLQGAV